MPTTNLSILSANLDPTTGEKTCFVNPNSPLYIYELIIEAYTNLGPPVGVLRPGTAQHPVLRTIFVDSTHPVFTTLAPFTLAVTYDAAYKLIELHVVQQFARSFKFDPSTDLHPDQTSVFVTRVMEAAAQLFNSPSAAAARAMPAEAMASAFNEGARARGNGGHDSHVT